jgi:hypothetical protein
MYIMGQDLHAERELQKKAALSRIAKLSRKERLAAQEARDHARTQWSEENRGEIGAMLEALGKTADISSKHVLAVTFDELNIERLHAAYGEELAKRNLPHTGSSRDTFGWLQTIVNKYHLRSGKTFTWSSSARRDMQFKADVYVSLCREFDVTPPASLEGPASTPESPSGRMM